MTLEEELHRMLAHVHIESYREDGTPQAKFRYVFSTPDVEAFFRRPDVVAFMENYKMKENK